MVFMMMRYRISPTHSFGFISFQNTRKFCLNFVGCTTPTIFKNLQGIAGATDVSNFLRAFLMVSLNEFRVLGVDEIDPSQFSCVFQMDLLVRPHLLLLQHGVLSNRFPEF